MPSSAATGDLKGLDDDEKSAQSAETEQVRAACAGDPAAFQDLYTHYRGAVRAVVLSRVGWQEADDITQDVFLTAWQRLEQLRDPTRFGPWLLQCARNRCRDQHRRRKNLPLTDSTATPQVTMPPRAEALEVLAALQQLSPSYRETLAMRLIEGLSGPEIAARTGLTPRSVRVNLHRGLQKLRTALGENTKGKGS